MDFTFLEQVSGGRYIRGMYDGNVPAQREARESDRGMLDWWNTEYGVGFTYRGGSLFYADLQTKDGVHIYAHWDGRVCIGKVLATKCKEWTNIEDLRYRNFTLYPVEEYTAEELRRILDTIPRAVFYDLVKERVRIVYKEVTGDAL